MQLVKIRWRRSRFEKEMQDLGKYGRKVYAAKAHPRYHS